MRWLLFVSARTVKHHRANKMKRPNLKEIADLISCAFCTRSSLADGLVVKSMYFEELKKKVAEVLKISHILPRQSK